MPSNQSRVDLSPQEHQHLRAVVLANSYPTHVVDCSLKEHPNPPLREAHDKPSPPPALCQRCQWMNRASVQTPRDQTTSKSQRTLREALVHTKQSQPALKRKGVAYQVPCADSNCVYIWETGRTLEKRLSKRRGAVKRIDSKNGIAVYAWKTQRKMDWEFATFKQADTNYTWRKIVEAIHIKKQKAISNLDCGRSLCPVWQSLLCSP